MLKLPSLFKPVYYKRFNYKPRYFDEEKEKREERKRELENINSADRKNFREYARTKWAKERKTERKQSNTRLVTIILVLFLVAYLLFRNAS